MFGLFRKKAKKVQVEPEKQVIHDEYEAYRMMLPEDLEHEAQAKDAQANRLATKWNHMPEEKKNENMDMYFECLNLRKEARFLRELKSDPDAKAPELFTQMSPKPKNIIQALQWEIKSSKENK